MSKFTPRQPDYDVSAIDTATNAKARVGAAWNQGDGTIRIKLNAFVILQASDSLLLTLFPVNKGTTGSAPRQQGGSARPGKPPFKPRREIAPHGGEEDSEPDMDRIGVTYPSSGY
jgi:hypothetical protein